MTDRRNAFKEFLQKEVAAFSEELKQVALRIWEKPELAWKEEFAAKELCAFLTGHGVETHPGLYEYPTAFRGETSGNGAGKVFAFAAEYDALPPGHACGHNLIGAASVGAMCAASAAMKKFSIPGKLVILGTPAEESGSGKVHLLRKGVLEGVDAVMMSHPHWCTMKDTGSLAIRRYDVIFHGVASHAAGSPELGINALDAVMLLFSAVNAFRQQMPEICRIHGIVKNGGAMPNIIPAEASCRFYLRSGSEVWMEKLDQRFREMVQGAALMTGARAELKGFSTDCRGRKPNSVLDQTFLEMMADQGEKVVHTDSPGKASSDFGDFSRAIPGSHPYFGISPESPMGAHSPDFQEAARTEQGLQGMLHAAAALAYTACCYLTDEKMRCAVQEEFEKPE